MAFLYLLCVSLKGEEEYDLLQYRFALKKKSEDNIGDIFDGQLSLHFGRDSFVKGPSVKQNQNEDHFSLQTNKDGVALFNSSKFSI